MNRRSSAVLLGTAICAAFLASSAPAGAAAKRPSISISPSQHLSNGQVVTIRGSGLPKTKNGSIVTWFASECIPKAASVRNLDPDYSPYCSPTAVVALHVLPRGSFTARFTVATGRVGNGECGTPGHLSCVIGIGTAQGHPTTVKIRFAAYIPKGSHNTTTTRPHG